MFGTTAQNGLKVYTIYYPMIENLQTGLKFENLLFFFFKIVVNLVCTINYNLIKVFIFIKLRDLKQKWHLSLIQNFQKEGRGGHLFKETTVVSVEPIQVLLRKILCC